jgi:SAM-dependent methyltransferase
MKTHHESRLLDIELTLDDRPLPPHIAALLADAKGRIESLEDNSRAAMPAFVPSDFELVYRALTAVGASNLAAGRRFLEWGSGIGVITCLATELGFDSVGIEIEQPLVDLAQHLAESHAIECQFVCGSFVPRGLEVHIQSPDDFAWMTTDAQSAYEELGLDPDDFDLIFAYPWPGEEQVIFDLFADCASTGALLLTYHGLEGVRLQRKTKR